MAADYEVEDHSASSSSAFGKSVNTEPSIDAVAQAKIARITEACRLEAFEDLTILASSQGGLISDDLRQKAWPILLGIGSTNADGGSQHEKEESWQLLPEHHDEGQVQLDVDRSFVNYPKNETEKQIEARKFLLKDVIVEVLRRHPSLCYFQGYHDIVQVFLLVLGPTRSVLLLRRLSLLRIRDFLLPKLSASVSHLKLLPAILYEADRQIFDILPSNPFYGLSHVLTLYAHDIESYSDIARLFDFLLAREAVMTIYVFAVIIISRRDELLEFMSDDPDPNIMSAVLGRMPKDLDLEDLIQRAMQLFDQYPPDGLPFRSWKRISEQSVLKTTMNPAAVRAQTLEQGQIWFDKQADDIIKEERRKQMFTNVKSAFYRHRRPAVFVLSVFVAICAYNFGGDNAVLGFVRHAWNMSKFGRVFTSGVHRQEL